jgi:hypothetical protein
MFLWLYRTCNICISICVFCRGLFLSDLCSDSFSHVLHLYSYLFFCRGLFVFRLVFWICLNLLDLYLHVYLCFLSRTICFRLVVVFCLYLLFVCCVYLFQMCVSDLCSHLLFVLRCILFHQDLMDVDPGLKVFLLYVIGLNSNIVLPVYSIPISWCSNRHTQHMHTHIHIHSLRQRFSRSHIAGFTRCIVLPVRLVFPLRLLLHEWYSQLGVEHILVSVGFSVGGLGPDQKQMI